MPFGQYTIPGFNPYAPMIQIPASGDPGVSGMPAGAPPAPAPQGRFQGLLSALSGPSDPSLDPAAQQSLNNQFLLNLGGGLLAGSRSGQGFGGIFGNALQGAQQAKQQSIDSQLQRVLLKAKLKQAQEGDKGDLVAIVGDDGNPQYVRASDAIGKRPYANQGTQAAPPASLQEYGEYVKQEIAAGRKPVDFLPFQEKLSKARVGAPYTQSVQMVGGAPTGVQFDRTGQTAPTQTPLNTPQGEIDAAVARALAEERAKSSGAVAGKVDAERAATFQQDLGVIDDEILRTQRILTEFQQGKYQTGPLAGRLPNISDSAQNLEREQGRDVLKNISSATFGALSEGERQFLKGIGIDPSKNEGSNISYLEERLSSLQKAKQRLQSRGPVSVTQQSGSPAPGVRPPITSFGTQSSGRPPLSSFRK